MPAAMGFGTALAVCFRKFVTFSGRAPRAEYWWFMLFSVGIGTLGDVIDESVGNLLSFVFFLPQLSVGWRRMHDIGKSGAWTLLPLLALLPASVIFFNGMTESLLYASIALFVVLYVCVIFLAAKRGDVGPNEYGDDPYGMGADLSVFD